jgi:hypothetical protein
MTITPLRLDLLMLFTYHRTATKPVYRTQALVLAVGGLDKELLQMDETSLAVSLTTAELT